jgi:hypothetical protein
VAWRSTSPGGESEVGFWRAILPKTPALIRADPPIVKILKDSCRPHDRYQPDPCLRTLGLDTRGGLFVFVHAILFLPPDAHGAPGRPDLPGPVPCGDFLRLFTTFDSDSALRDGAGERVDTGFPRGQYPAVS